MTKCLIYVIIEVYANKKFALKEYMSLLKTFFVSLSAVVFATAVGFGGWKAYNTYTVFSNTELEALVLNVVQLQTQAYQLGAQSCNKTL